MWTRRCRGLAALSRCALVLIVFQIACSKNVPEHFSVVPPMEPLSCNAPFTDLLHGPTGDLPAEFRVVSDVTAWCQLWDQMHANTQPAPVCDTSLVDFSREVAVVASLGGPNSCYSAKITCIHRADISNDITVRVTVSQPGAGCVCLAVITKLLDIVKTSRPVGLANFDQQTDVFMCP